MAYSGRPTYFSAVGASTPSSSAPTFRKSVKVSREYRIEL